MLRLFARFVPTVAEYHGPALLRAVSRGGASPRRCSSCSWRGGHRPGLRGRLDPAIFAITQDPFIVYTSNIFAILGLRALYFLLAGVMDRFRYLKFGLAVILVFVGAKMLLSDFYKIPIGVSLGVVAGIFSRGGRGLCSSSRSAASSAAARGRVAAVKNLPTSVRA